MTSLSWLTELQDVIVTAASLFSINLLQLQDLMAASGTPDAREQTANVRMMHSGHGLLCIVGCRGVQCLAYSSSRSSVLLSSGRDGQVCTLDLATGSKQAQFKGSKHSLTAAALSTGVQQQQRVFSWHIISLAPYLVSSGRASGRNVLCQWGPIMRDHAGLQRHTQTSNGPAGNARCL
eukprot:GHUV01032950.1.p1 GENE.GHUV01032950.1~~GHUV01032950.1.p1  ORF type:complete len:178 (+),score=41.94 GHUV01032950.1:687-1220(+)